VVPLKINMCKVNAAARSLHQFLPAVRSIYGQEVEPAVLEAATVYLYVRVAREVFGLRFSDRLCGQVRMLLRHLTEEQARERVARLSTRAEAHFACELAIHGGSAEEQFRSHVRSAIKSMLEEAGQRSDDEGRVSSGFAPFEEAARRIKIHLTGIKRQNRFVMS